MAIFGDYVTGGASQPLGRRSMGRSLDNTLRVAQLKPTEWVLCDIRIHAVVNGYAQGVAFLWSQDGEFLGHGQPVVRRPPVAGRRRSDGMSLAGWCSLNPSGAIAQSVRAQH